MRLFPWIDRRNTPDAGKRGGHHDIDAPIYRPAFWGPAQKVLGMVELVVPYVTKVVEEQFT